MSNNLLNPYNKNLHLLGFFFVEVFLLLYMAFTKQPS